MNELISLPTKLKKFHFKKKTEALKRGEEKTKKIRWKKGTLNKHSGEIYIKWQKILTQISCMYSRDKESVEENSENI